MSCSEIDLKAYFLDELAPTERQAVRDHLRLCADCGVELEALAETRAALLSVPEEEPPRRIAFVSDKVFEPNWWQRLWRSGPQLGFLGATALALAIVLHALIAPAPSPAPPAVAFNDAAMETAVTAAVSKAVAEAEARHKAELQQVIDDRLHEVERRHENVLRVLEAGYEERIERLRRANSVRIRNAYYEAGVFEQ
jgi:anti-sigma factor RsiW